MTVPTGFAPYEPFQPEIPVEEAARRFFETMRRRRSVRFFSDRPVPRAVIEHLVAAAGTAPSGANKQPWRFVAVGDPALKREIRRAAEEEERAFYERRANEAWLRDLAHLGTDEQKPFLETAPWLIVVFKLMKDDAATPESPSAAETASPADALSPATPESATGRTAAASSDQVYYVNESVGIATGMLITAIHLAGLVTLTHTPSPMKFLARILGRPDHERPFLLLPVGYPADDCVVPEIGKKELGEILVVKEGDGATERRSDEGAREDITRTGNRNAAP